MQTVPYTYFIGWANLNIWYIGVRFAKGCHPSDLWSKYFTSSKYVKDFCLVNGPPDSIIIDGVHKDTKSALSRETSLLKRFMLRKDLPLLNKAVAGNWDRGDREIAERHRAAHIGKVFSSEQRRKIGEGNRGKKISDVTRAAISVALKGKVKSTEHRMRMSEVLRGTARRKGFKTSTETKLKIRSARLGTQASEETKLKMSVARSGKKFNIVTCPHCPKSGGESAMRRWHFNHCKFKQES